MCEKVTSNEVTTGSRPLYVERVSGSVTSVTFLMLIRSKLLVTWLLVTKRIDKLVKREVTKGNWWWVWPEDEGNQGVSVANCDGAVIVDAKRFEFVSARHGCSWPAAIARLCNSWAGRIRRTLRCMAARDPFVLDKDSTERDTEYGFGAGKFPDPRFDYSDGGARSQVPIADPTRHDQELELTMIRRMDVADPNDQPSPYVEGNTDRYGAQPPLVRERKPPRYRRTPPAPPKRMQRQW